jgi:hypothetical protein
MNVSNVSDTMFCEVLPPLFRQPTLLDILKAFSRLDDAYIVRMYALIFLILYLSYLLSDKTVGYEFDGDDEPEPEESTTEEDEEPEESTTEEDEEPEELLRFETEDIKYDQAANILAFIYSCGLTMPDVKFPIKSWSIKNKRISIKESSFILKVKKYREDPSENMKSLIRMRPSITQLMEAYAYYSEAEGRLYSIEQD